MNDNLTKFLQDSFNIHPKNLDLYSRALTHRSYLNETKEKNLSSYERLEFLGDAILSFCISKIIYEKFPLLPEGDLTNLRSALVKTETLASLSRNIGLGKYLLLSKGESESNGKNNRSILADSMEAVIAAIYLDLGIDKIQTVIQNIFSGLISEEAAKKELKDYKSLLQEKSQEKSSVSPVYKVTKEEGPDHHKLFTVEVSINNKILAKGQGFSKQKAEEEAAKIALEKI